MDEKMTGEEVVNLPRGSKVLFLFSFGIDSPVAYAMLKKRFDVTPIHFLNLEFLPPGTIDIMEDMLRIVKEKIGMEKMYIVSNYSDILNEIYFKVKRKYICVFCRKAMIKIAEKIALEKGFSALASGESLSQKASQTIYNFVSTHSNLSIPFLTPLLGLDKDEIVEYAREFDMFFEKHVGKCDLAPKYPVTMTDWKKIEREFEEKILPLLANIEVKEITEPKEIREVFEYG